MNISYTPVPYYTYAKAVRKGELSLNPDFGTLIDWIEETYSFRPISFYRDQYAKRARLIMILERKSEREQLETGKYGQAKKDILQAILIQYKVILKRFANTLEIQQIDSASSGMFIMYEVFEEAAQYEANSNIPQIEIDTLIAKLGIKNLWTSARWGNAIAFFFETNVQNYAFQKSEQYPQLVDGYFQCLKKYDEFDFYQKTDLNIRLESKEAFDKNCNGSWRYYFT